MFPPKSIEGADFQKDERLVRKFGFEPSLYR
jgi:hypothetical protein